MSTIALKALGDFTIACDGRGLPPLPTKKARALVVYLVMHRAADVSREQLLEIFWRDFDPQRGRDNLNATLWSVRRMFRNAALNPDDIIRTDRTIVRWHASVDFDVDRLFALSEKMSEAAAEQALALYRGDFLEGDFDDWSVAERERISLAYETLLGRATRSFGSISAAERLIGRNPYDEAAYVTLIESQLKMGHAVASAILVERCRRALDEVGVKPSDEFEQRFGSLRRPREEAHSELRIPFVARDDELRSLAERFRQCALGKGSVTLVHGDAGIGKSTLLAHASRLALEHCSHVAQISCNGKERQHLAKVADAIAVAAQPFVVVVDDAQNLAADALLTFLHLLEAAAERHCFIVATRQEALAALRSRLERCAPFEIALGPLSRSDVEGALRQATGSELSEVSAKLFERTRGHPLYVVRLLEALVENGALEHRRKAWSVTKKFDEALPLPGSVRAFIEARLLARGNVAATVAGALALETLATAANLGSALSVEEETLLDALDDLLALGLIRQPQTGPQFEFSHDLIREVAASQLNAGRAVRIHRRFAELLQHVPERDAPSRVATHLLAAGDALGAGEAFARVAHSALDDKAFHDAIAACSRAIDALGGLESSQPRDEVLATLFRTRSQAYFAIAEVGAALNDADRAVSLERGAGTALNLGQALVARALCNGWANRWDLATHDLEETVTLARGAGDAALLAKSLAELAGVARSRGDRESALALGREAYDIAVAGGDWGRAHCAVAELLLACLAWWDVESATRLAATSRELVQRCGEDRQACHYDLVAVLSYVRERYADARRDLAKASEIDRRASPPATFFNRLMSGIVALEEARWNEALDLAAKMETQGDMSALPAQTVTLGVLRAEALLSRDGPGDSENAERALACSGAGENALFPWNLCVEITRARVSARLGRSDSEFLLRNALDAAEERAHEVPFDADRAYAQIELACRIAGNDVLEARAALQRAHYRRVRRAAVGDGNPTISLPNFPSSLSREAMPRTSS
ncbi:MAG: AAA family ATPase [Candidatus Tumulicola sp.]